MKKFLVIISCLLFVPSVFPKTGSASRPRNSTNSTNKPSLYSTVRRLQDEVSDVELKTKNLIYDAKKHMSERNVLMDDLDDIIQKIDKGEINCWNDEVEDINNRIGDGHDKSKDINQRHKKLRDRKVAIEFKLKENPRLNEWIGMDSLYEVCGEWDDLMRENNPQSLIYNDKVKEFNKRVENF